MSHPGCPDMASAGSRPRDHPQVQWFFWRDSQNSEKLPSSLTVYYSEKVHITTSNGKGGVGQGPGDTRLGAATFPLPGASWGHRLFPPAAMCDNT